MRNFSVYVINSLDDRRLNNTLASLKKTTPQSAINNLTIVSERNTREDTLNYIFTQETTDDLLIVADDIVFTENWVENLQKNYDSAGIFGFTTLYPNTDIVQDHGYDFVTIDGELSYEAYLKNVSFQDSGITCSRECSSVCGCVMYIKRNVISLVNKVPPEGNNRIGEMIFSKLARDKGQVTKVLSSRVYHESISTKNTGDPKKSSLSWLYERDNWRYVSKEFFGDVHIKKAYHRHLDDRLCDLLKSSSRVVFYGCGTIADYLIETLGTSLENYKVVSGLDEEIGKRFGRVDVDSISSIEFLKTDTVLITAVGYEKLIYNKYFKDKDLIKIFYVLKQIKEQEIIYNYAEFKF